MGDRYISKWHREFSIFYKIKSMLLLEGNIMDLYQYPEDRSILTLPCYLEAFLKQAGYRNVISFQNVDGFRAVNGDEQELERFRQMSHCETAMENSFLKVPFANEGENAAELIRRAVVQQDEATAVILEFSSRYISAPDNLTQEETDSFTRLMIAAQNAGEVDLANGGFGKNLIICLVNKTNDLPAWFCLDNPYVGILHLSTPDARERMDLVSKDRFESFFNRKIYREDISYYEEHPYELEKIKERFVGLTEGFSFLELNDIRKLCRNERCRISQMTDMVDLYRYGIKENPWTSEALKQSLSDGRRRLLLRVKGQEQAVERTLDVIKRAATGLSGLQHSSHTKPKGILFFAGPTGTGKTETAKALAEMIFGEERRCIRFDMSEYASPNSDQRLLGAPPGYVGYQAGGQLTNAVRENPFSILLFDEIEKAHSSIFDKFLQILEDGRMTDGQGKTVYFSETVIIFTSNLGIYRMNADGRRSLNINPEESFAVIEEKVREAIEDFFKIQLGRPEILNRIGENIVVFDFIRETTARVILDAQLEKIIVNLKLEKNITLVIEEIAKERIFEKAKKNLVNGGRGIGNVVEDMVLNPLARYIFDENCGPNSFLTIKDVQTSTAPFVLDIVQE